MSKAGVLSHQGDEYQVRIALKWIVRLLLNDCIRGIQVESTGFPGDGVPPFIDDVVVKFVDGHSVYIQAKKNEPNHRTWTLKNSTLKDELLKARNQLVEHGVNPRTTVRFYSRSPFGNLHSAAERARMYSDVKLFQSDAPQNLKSELENLAELWGMPPEDACILLAKLHFTTTEDFEDLDLDLIGLLSSRFESPKEVRRILEEIIRKHQLRLGDSPAVLRKSFIELELRQRGHIPSPRWSEAELLASFKECSAVGKYCIRDIEGHQFNRSETEQVLKAIDDGVGAVLIKGEPGIGKTCILLDVAEKLEKDQRKAVLFVKGDEFGGARSLSELAEYGFPDKIVERCTQLTDYRKVVVLIDSLDVLSLQRAHGSFRLFLNLLDRLLTVRSVTIVATCRSFDLEFDSKLRGRKWDKTITVEPLRIESDLTGILSEWNIKYANLDRSLQEQLRVPGRLWVFAQLRGDRKINAVNSVYDLHLRFLQSICGEPEWGTIAWDAITRAASLMQERRRLQIAGTSLNISSDLLQFLQSQQILIRLGSSYAFRHQEFLDVVLVRDAILKNQSVADFVLSQHTLPFMRPTVRVFLHILRSGDHVQFRREVRALLEDDKVVYHIKRLVVESLGEMHPVEKDLPLFRYIMQKHEDLFLRFVERTVGNAWVDTFVNGLRPLALSNDSTRHLVGRILRLLLRWVITHPEIVLLTWKNAIERREANDVYTRRKIANGVLKCLEVYDPADLPIDIIASLIRHFVDDTSLIQDAPFAVGPIIRVLVGTQQCDDLLLSYLGLDTQSKLVDFDQRVRSLITEDTANESPVKFLSTRMSASTPLINAVMKKVLHQSETWGHSNGGELIYHTSWIERHFGSPGPRDILIQAFEDALLERGIREDQWWLEHERNFRTHENVGVRYLAISVYRHSPEFSKEGISALLSDPDTYEYKSLKLESEVRELANVAYPYLNETVFRRHQVLLLSCLGDKNSETGTFHRNLRRTYESIIWIPKPYLIKESVQFLETYGKHFAPWRPTPRIHVTAAGHIPYPILPTELQKMSNTGILKLISFFGTEINWQSRETSREGGWEQLKSALEIAAMNAPARAIQWVNTLTEEDAEQPYIDACIEGVARHVLALSGDLRSNGEWAPTEPLSDGLLLSHQLIHLIDLPSATGIAEEVRAKALWACSCTLDDSESTSKLTSLLERLARSKNPGGFLGSYSAEFEALNSVRGIVAQSAVTLACRLAEKGCQLRRPLRQLLRGLIQDARPGVRLSILYSLPSLMRSDPDLAWSLLTDAAAIARHPDEWEQIESCLYQNYHNRLDLVEPILKQLRMSALDIAGATYGRIVTLLLLSEHLRWESFSAIVVESPSEVWDGVFEILAVNLIDQRIHSVCESALIQFLHEPNLPKRSLESLFYAVTRPKTQPHLTERIVQTLIAKAIEYHSSNIGLDSIFEWVARHMHGNPHTFLDLLEELVGEFENGSIQLPSISNGLASMLVSMIREADESDDRSMIRRTIRLQNRLLHLGVSDVDRMLDEASRP